MLISIFLYLSEVVLFYLPPIFLVQLRHSEQSTNDFTIIKRKMIE